MKNKKLAILEKAIRRWFLFPRTIQEVKQFEKDNPEPFTEEEQKQLDSLNIDRILKWKEKRRW